MEELDAEEMSLIACELFNALSDAHNAMMSTFLVRGVTKEQAALASYMAARTIVHRFEGYVNQMVADVSKPVVEAVIRAMIKSVKTPENTTPTALA